MSEPWMDNIGTASFRRVRTVAVNQSPFTGATYRSGMADSRWQFRFDYQIMTRPQAQPLLALIAGQGEGTGTFFVFDPDFGTPASGFTATGLVNGSGQTGSAIGTRRWTPFALVAKAGDRVFVQVGATCQMFVVLQDTFANNIGNTTFPLDAPLRGSVVDGDIVGLAPALTPALRMPARLVSHDVSTQPGGLYSISVQGEEIV